jgi:DNA invertase Pin-like site-specific DNA recombinase
MKFLYVRVSTKEQKTARQEVLQKDYKVDQVYIDKCSGKDTNRPQLKAMFSKLRKGDTVIVESYSRISRSTKDLLNIVEQLNYSGVNFISVKEKLDTTTPTGRLMLTMFAGLYQFEREVMLDRQREGIAIARQQGKYKDVGRKKIKPNDKIFATLYKQWKNKEIKAKDFMQALGLKRNTFYRRVKEFELIIA